jgi:hypothetical protein
MSDSNNDKPKPISLSEFIEQVKQDLLQKPKPDSIPLFAIEKIEIEAQVIATKEQGGDAGIKLSILNFGARANVSSKSTQMDTQTVKVTLSPLLSKEQLVAQMTPEMWTNVQQQAKVAMSRGSDAPREKDEI